MENHVANGSHLVFHSFSGDRWRYTPENAGAIAIPTGIPKGAQKMLRGSKDI